MLLLNPDRGDRYIETVYNPDWLDQQHIHLLQGSELNRAMQALPPVPLESVPLATLPKSQGYLH